MKASTKHVSFFIGVLAVSIAVAVDVPAAPFQWFPCRTNPDTVELALNSVKQLLALNDLDSSSVAAVSDSSTCQVIVDTYNAASDSSLAISSGSIMRSDTTYRLYLSPVVGTPYRTELLVLFDSTFHILVRMPGLKDD
jgi:hypothetical protein